MPPFRQVIRDTLANDATLAAILVGGVKNADQLPQDGGGRESMPKIGSSPRVAPHGVIRWRTGSGLQTESPKLAAEAESFEVYLYQDIGYHIIEQAIGQVKRLLHDQYFYPDDRAIAHVLFVHPSGEIPAKEGGGAPCRFVRFRVNTIRK